ncbi:hypothetical protein NDU88_002986 [Pleurodeles waltl]|uniref:Uncharacterized protein n=1 Tax=Pleurodeles waltl TaxID=8319 RepID=A0AAV7VFZ6_PLEWA|nr:hypothetical protein NDU88_002986 [Pleurodeles waltl]
MGAGIGCRPQRYGVGVPRPKGTTHGLASLDRRRPSGAHGVTVGPPASCGRGAGVPWPPLVSEVQGPRRVRG